MKVISLLTVAMAALALTACSENRASKDWVDTQIKFDPPAKPKKGGGDAGSQLVVVTTDAAKITDFLTSLKNGDAAAYDSATAAKMAADLVDQGVTAASFTTAYGELAKLTGTDGKAAYDNAGLLAGAKDIAIAVKGREVTGLADAAGSIKAVASDAKDAKPEDKALTAEKANAVAILLVKLEKFDLLKFNNELGRVTNAKVTGVSAIRIACVGVGVKGADFDAAVK